MAVQKGMRFEYQAKLNAKALTDVKAQIYLNGVPKAVGANALLLSEIDATNSPGLYGVTISGATLTGWGVVSGQTNTVTAYITSATLPGASIAKEEQTITNLDDLNALIGPPVTGSVSGDIAAVQTKLGTPAAASVSADIAAVKAQLAGVIADLETAPSSLPNIFGALQTLQNASVENGVGYVLPSMAIPASGSQTYVFPITIDKDGGGLVDPTGNAITVSVANAAGTDRSSYLQGATGSPGTVPATRISTGQYKVTVNIPSTAPEEELIFNFAYSLAGNTYSRNGLTLLQNSVTGAGYSLQSTLLATQATVNSINSVVTNATSGNAGLYSQLTNATYGLSANQAKAQSILDQVNNATYGLSAAQVLQASIKSLLQDSGFGLAALQAITSATQGASFTAGQDDLHSLSTYLRRDAFVGGNAR